MSDAELTAIFGRRGCGKSTICKALLKSRSRVVVFDPCDEYSAGRGWVRVTSRKALAEAIAKRISKGFKIAYVPPEGDHIEALHWVAEIIWRAGEGGRNRHITLVIEEANMALPKHALPRDRSAAKRLILQGRHRGIEMIAVTQRPSLLSSDFIGNCATIYAFAVSDVNDVDTISRYMGRERKAEIAAQVSFKFLRRENGQICTGATTKAGSFKIDPVRT